MPASAYAPTTVSRAAIADRGAPRSRSAAHRERHDERDDADHPGELHQCAEAADHTRRRRVVALREHDRAEDRDAHEDVVAATVDEVERGERAQREERHRVGRSGATPDDARTR